MEESERFRRLIALFETVASAGPDERDRAIERECAGEPELAAELRQMLAYDVIDGESDRVWEIIGPAAEALAQAPVLGEKIGSWRVLSVIGEGGMGVVYLAERADGEFESKAAIKLVHCGVPNPLRDREFRAERQILARLSHPGIARLLDGGTTDEGTPFLVMEFVDGLPITRWCDAQALDLRERVELFLRVCDAVTYAHRSLVAHLDLKPSNVLVDGSGAVKLLDFGVAKLLGAEDESDPVAAPSMMTPAYASPEQLGGEQAGVTADVYSLGVILFEMLTGRLPIEQDGGSVPAWIRAVSEQHPPLVSRVARPRDRRRLRGGLEAIVARALRKDPKRRYASVQSLAEDLRRHLGGHAVSALGASWSYRARRWVGRNLVAVVVAVVAAIVVVGGALGFAWYAVLQARAFELQRDEAERQRATAERVSEFLQELLTEADPNEGHGANVTIRQVLDRGARRLVPGLDDQPEIQATLALLVGGIYRSWGELDAAEPLLDTALATRRELATSDPVALAAAQVERGALAYDRAAYKDALRLFEGAIAHNAEVVPGDSQMAVDAMGWMVSTYAALGELEHAKELAAQSLAMARRLHERPDPRVASAMVGLVDVLRDLGDWGEAEALITLAVVDFQELHGKEHLTVAHAFNHRSQILSSLGRYPQALRDARESLSIRRALLGDPHTEIAASLGSVAGILSRLGRLEESEATRRESLAQFRAVLGDDAHPYIAATLSSLGGILVERGKLEEAENILRESIEMLVRVYSDDHAAVTFPMRDLGRLLTRAGRAGEAEVVLSEALRICVGALPAGNWRIGATKLYLGEALDALGRVEEAETQLLAGYQLVFAQFGENDTKMRAARRLMRDHYVLRGRSDLAAGYE